MEPHKEKARTEIPKRWTDNIGLAGIPGIGIAIFGGSVDAQWAIVISLIAWGLPAIGIGLFLLDWRRQ